MALKSILDIDVEDAKFKRFAELFSKYNEALAKQPGMWSKVGKAQGEAAKTAAMMTAAMMAQADHMKEIAHAEREQQRHLTMASRLWTGIAGSAKSVAGSMLHATGTLLKWGGALLGIGGALATGTLFGLDRMAGDVANQRRTSMGLGMSIGSMKAFGTDFGRVVDPNSFLTGIMNMRTNPAMSGALWALGVNPTGSERHVAIEALNALRARAKATPDSQLGLILQSLPDMQGVYVEDLQRMKSMRSSEWNALMGHYARDRQSMNIGSSTALAWQNFSTQLERAGQQIFKTFVVGLAPLVKPMEGISRGIVHVLGIVMSKNGIVEEGINKLAKWLNDWNGKITKPAFLKSVAGFTSDVGIVAQDMHDFAMFLNAFKKHPLTTTWNEFWKGEVWLGNKILGNTRGMRYNNPGNLMYAGQRGAWKGKGGLAEFSNRNQGLDAMARQLELYYGRGYDTTQSIVSHYAPASAGNDVPAYIRAVDAQMGVTATQRLNLDNAKTLAQLMRAMIHHEQGYQPGLFGGVGRAAAHVAGRFGTIRIENATGGSAHVAVNGLAQ